MVNNIININGLTNMDFQRWLSLLDEALEFDKLEKALGSDETFPTITVAKTLISYGKRDILKAFEREIINEPKFIFLLKALSILKKNKDNMEISFSMFPELGISIFPELGFNLYILSFFFQYKNLKDTLSPAANEWLNEFLTLKTFQELKDWMSKRRDEIWNDLDSVIMKKLYGFQLDSIYSSPEFKIYEFTNYVLARKVGGNTQWCVSSPTSGKEHLKKYHKDGYKLYALVFSENEKYLFALKSSWREKFLTLKEKIDNVKDLVEDNYEKLIAANYYDDPDLLYRIVFKELETPEKTKKFYNWIKTLAMKPKYIGDEDDDLSCKEFIKTFNANFVNNIKKAKVDNNEDLVIKTEDILEFSTYIKSSIFDNGRRYSLNIYHQKIPISQYFHDVMDVCNELANNLKEVIKKRYKDYLSRYIREVYKNFENMFFAKNEVKNQFKSLIELKNKHNDDELFNKRIIEAYSKIPELKEFFTMKKEIERKIGPLPMSYSPSEEFVDEIMNEENFQIDRIMKHPTMPKFMETIENLKKSELLQDVSKVSKLEEGNSSSIYALKNLSIYKLLKKREYSEYFKNLLQMHTYLVKLKDPENLKKKMEGIYPLEIAYNVFMENQTKHSDVNEFFNKLIS